MHVVLTRWASTFSAGQNDFPDLSHPHLPFNLLLSNCASYISPPSSHPPPPQPLKTHPPVFLPPFLLSLSLSLYSAGGPARRQRTRLPSVIYFFSPFPFPFQSHVHSWNQGAVHADEHGLGFFFFFFRRKVRQRGGGGGAIRQRSKSLRGRKTTVNPQKHLRNPGLFCGNRKGEKTAVD